MNIKIGIKVTKDEFDGFLTYVKDSGYKITEQSAGQDALQYYANIPDHYGGATPLGEMVKDCGSGRWTRWIYIRIPKKNEKSDVIMTLPNY